MFNYNTESKIIMALTVLGTFIIVSIGGGSALFYLIFNIFEPIVAHYNKPEGLTHHAYIPISIAYIASIPLFIGIISEPVGIQRNYYKFGHPLRQCAIHTPMAMPFIVLIYFTRIEHPFVTLLLYTGLTFTAIITYISQHFYNIAHNIHQEYEKNITRLSQHNYIQHLRTTNIRKEPNQYLTLFEKILLPPYYDTIKKHRYNKKITSKEAQ